MTDRIFRASVARLAEARASASAATYCYEFRWGTSAFFGVLGAAHCIDIPFVFNSLDSAKGRLIKETAPRPLAAHVHHAWTEFVSGGDPGWPRYEAPIRSVMALDTVSRLDDDPVALARSLWP